MAANDEQVTDGRRTQAQAQSALDAFGAVDFDVDLDTGSVRSTARLDALLGYAEQHPLTRDDFYSRVHPDDAVSLRAIVPNAVGRGETRFEREFRVLLPDGTVRWLYGRGEVVVAGGRARRIRGACFDITDRKQVEDTAREIDARYHALTQMSPTAILVHCGDRFVYANDAAARLLRASSPRELLGRTPYEMLAPDYHELVRTRSGHVLQHRSMAPRVRYRWIRLDGTEVDVDVAVAWIQWQGEDAVQVVGHDITEEILVEEALREHRALIADQLAEVSRLQAISARLIEADDANAIYREVLNEAVLLTHADCGSVHRLEADRVRLRLIAWQGFEPAALLPPTAFALEARSAAGHALRMRERVLVESVQASADLVGARERLEYDRSGIMALQVTPLVARDGTPVGILATHWRGPPRVSDRQLRLLDVLARQAADLLERHEARDRLQAAERRQSFLLSLNDALGGLDDAAEIRRRACALVGEHLAADRVHCAEFHDGHDVVSVVAEYARPGLPSRVGHYPLDAFADTPMALRAARTMTGDDVASAVGLSGSARATCRALGIAAFISVPLVRDGRVAASLSVLAERPREWSADEVSLVEAAADRTWTAAERARAERELADSQAALRGFYDSSPRMMGIVELGAGQVVAIDTNEAAARFFGARSGLLYPPSRTGGSGTMDAGSPWADQLRKALFASQPVRFDLVHRTAQGARWLDVTVAHLGTVATGRPRFSFIAEDVTERRHVAEAARESEARRAFLLIVGDALRPLTQARDIQREGCRVVRRLLGVDRVALGDVVDDEFVLTAVDAAPESGPGPARLRLADIGPAHAAELRAGRVVSRDDAGRIAGDGDDVGDVAAGVFAPLVRDGRLVAILTAQHRGARAWTANDRATLAEAADLVSVAAERARVETAVRASEARLAGMIEALPVGVALLDREGAVLVANAEVRRFLAGGDGSELDARYGPWCGHHADGRRIERPDYPDARALRGERVVPGIEFLFTGADGKVLWTRVAAAPIRDQAGRITGAVVVITDIDAMKRAADAGRVVYTLSPAATPGT